MKYLSFMPWVAVAFLAGCNAGAGGGSDNSGNRTTQKADAKNNARSQLVAPKNVSYELIENKDDEPAKVKYTLRANGDVISDPTGEGNGVWLNGVENPMNAALVVDTFPSDPKRVSEFSGYWLYKRDNGALASAAVYEVSEEFLKANFDRISDVYKDPKEFITISDVAYDITVLTPNGQENIQSFDDDENRFIPGSIAIVDGKFSGNMRDLKLEETPINGYRVEGDVRFRDMKGQYKGMIGPIAKGIDHEGLVHSEGVMAGDNGKDSVFAGRWGP